MPKAIAALAAACLVLQALPAAAAASPDHARASRTAACAYADAQPRRAKVRHLRRATLCLVNRERALRGLARLRPNRRLQHAAWRFSRTMRVQRFFAHVSPRGTTMVDRIMRTGYARRAAGWSLGENIAWGTGRLSTPRRIMVAWMNSDGHRANILAPGFREIGIGIVRGNPSGGREGATYTTNFGAR